MGEVVDFIGWLLQRISWGMAGLGSGSAWAGRRAEKFHRPLLATV